MWNTKSQKKISKFWISVIVCVSLFANKERKGETENKVREKLLYMWRERSVEIAQELLAQSQLEKWKRLRLESTSSCSTLYTTPVIHGRFSCHYSSPLLYCLCFCKAYKMIYWQFGYLSTITRDVDCGRVEFI